MKYINSLIAVLLLCSFHTYASHLRGGEISYEYNGSAYAITVHLYQDCSGIALPGSVQVTVRSANAGSNFVVTAQMVSLTEVLPPCPASPTKCQSSTSLVPGMKLATYKATVALPSAQADWVFEHSSSARTSMVNLAGSSNLYLVATLNNVSGENTNALIAQHGPVYITTATTDMPIQAVDADGDSLVIERTAAMAAAGTSVTYAPGYSATTPFGATGTYNINNTTQIMTLKPVTFGNFNLAFLVKEYRNGNLVATYMRDFAVFVLPGTSSYSFPAINSLSSAVAYACPGAAGSATLSFTDPVSSDSVYIDAVDTPAAVTGWNFGISKSNGSPTGSVTVSWTAPSSLNPSTLPYFYVHLKVRDNACPRGHVAYTLLVRTQQCPTDSVWPGDANSDKIANLWDVLAVAVAYGQTGPARPGASTAWVPQWSANWAANYPFTTVNIKHGDCNGNGVVNLGDLGAIASNYGLTHPKGGPRSKTSGVPDLYFDMAGITLTPGASVSIPVKLGSTADPMNDFYGLGANVQVNGLSLTTQATMTASASSWVGTASNTLTFTKNFGKSTFDWAMARTDHQNISGNGEIATLNFTVPADATPGTTVNLVFDDAIMIDKDGNPITSFNTTDASATVEPVRIAEKAVEGNWATVIPNPSGDYARLQVQLAKADNVDIIIVDVTGKTVYSLTEKLNAGSSYIELPAGQLAKGVYTIRLSGALQAQTVKWVKQ